MSRFVTIPDFVLLENPLGADDDPPEPGAPPPKPPKRVSFARVVRVALVLCANAKSADVFALHDLRAKFDAASVGATVQLTDDEWRLLADQFRRPDPQSFGHDWVFAGETHQRAVLDAPTKAPASFLETTKEAS